MIIRIKKASSSEQGILTCIRDDGSQTWQASSDYFAHHDLIHYAVESRMGYADAFYGMINAGRELDAFGTRDGEQDILPQQALQAETIVGLLQWPGVSGGADLTESEFFEMLPATCLAANLPTPAISSQQLADIRKHIRILHAQWDALQPGQCMELEFQLQ